MTRETEHITSGELLEESDEELGQKPKSDDITPFLAGGQVGDSLDTGWMVPYGNMVTILMIFFMVLFAFSHQKSSAFDKAVHQIQNELQDSLEENVEEALAREQETEVAEAIETYLDDEKLREYARVQVTAQHIHISLANPVLFTSGNAALSAEATDALHQNRLTSGPPPQSRGGGRAHGQYFRQKRPVCFQL